MKRLVVTVGVVGLAIGIAGATPPPSTPTTINIPGLVEQLGAAEFADREAAALALEKIGTPALDALRTALRSDNAEIRERAAVLYGKLKRLADSDTRLAAKRVALDYKNIPLGTAVNDLKLRTGLNLALDPKHVANPLRTITCQTAELPVWEALEVFCVAAGIRESISMELEVPKSTSPRRGYVPPPSAPDADAVPVVLIDGTPERLPASRSTAVRVQTLPATFPGHRITLSTGEILLALDVAPAPGIGWQEVTGMKIHKVIDAEGRAGGAGIDKNVLPTFDPTGNVIFARPGVAMRFDINGNSIMPEHLPNPRIVKVPLKLATSSARSLKRLEGSLFGEVQVANQTLITVMNPKDNANVVYDGPGELKFIVIEFKEPSGPGALGVMHLQMKYPSEFGLNARRRVNLGWPEAPRMGSYGNRVEAFDAAGNTLSMSGNVSTSFDGTGMTLTQTHTMTFQHGQGVPTKLVVIGAKQVTVEVPFVLENVPLP